MSCAQQSGRWRATNEAPGGSSCHNWGFLYLPLLCFALLFCSSFSPLLHIALRCFLAFFALLDFRLCFFSLLPVAFVFPLFQLAFNLDVLCWSFASISLSDSVTQWCSLCVPAVLSAGFCFPFLRLAFAYCCLF